MDVDPALTRGVCGIVDNSRKRSEHAFTLQKKCSIIMVLEGIP